MIDLFDEVRVKGWFPRRDLIARAVPEMLVSRSLVSHEVGMLRWTHNGLTTMARHPFAADELERMKSVLEWAKRRANRDAMARGSLSVGQNEVARYPIMQVEVAEVISALATHDAVAVRRAVLMAGDTGVLGRIVFDPEHGAPTSFSISPSLKSFEVSQLVWASAPRYHLKPSHSIQCSALSDEATGNG